jgi:phage gp16-like protein
MSKTDISKASDTRRKQLAAIHVLAQRKLRLDRDTYVALLQRVASVSSSADLDGPGRARVLDEMRRLLGERQRQMHNAVHVPGAPQHVQDELAAMMSKVGAILAEMGKSWNYAHGAAKRMFKVHRVEWLRPDQLHRLVAALQISANRRK